MSFDGDAQHRAGARPGPRRRAGELQRRPAAIGRSAPRSGGPGRRTRLRRLPGPRTAPARRSSRSWRRARRTCRRYGSALIPYPAYRYTMASLVGLAAGTGDRDRGRIPDLARQYRASYLFSAVPLALPSRTSETLAARLTVQATGHPARYQTLDEIAAGAPQALTRVLHGAGKLVRGDRGRRLKSPPPGPGLMPSPPLGPGSPPCHTHPNQRKPPLRHSKEYPGACGTPGHLPCQPGHRHTPTVKQHFCRSENASSWENQALCEWFLANQSSIRGR